MSCLPLDRSSLVGIDADQMTAWAVVDEPYLRNLATNLRGLIGSREAATSFGPRGWSLPLVPRARANNLVVDRHHHCGDNPAEYDAPNYALD